MGSTWTQILVCWKHVGAMLVHCGSMLGPFNAMLEHFGAMLSLLEPMLGLLEPMLGHFGAMLGHFGAMLAHFMVILWLSFALFVSCWSQVGAKRAQIAKTLKNHWFLKVFSVPGGGWESATDGGGEGLGAL